jgi:hypothetical protein
MLEGRANMTKSALLAEFGPKTIPIQPRDEVSKDYAEVLDRVGAEPRFLKLAGGDADEGPAAPSLGSEGHTAEAAARRFAPGGRESGVPERLSLEHLVDLFWRGRTIETTENWEGVVLEAQDGTFVAQLVDVRGQRPDEEAEFSVLEVPEGQRHLIEPGAVFTWKADLVRELFGSVSRRSVVRFRRVKPPTRRDRRRGAKLAQQVHSSFKIHS